MENSIGHFCDIEPLIDFNNFAELFLACLMNKSEVVFIGNDKIKSAKLPIYYKELIQDIMYEQKNWRIKIHILFDIRLYYDKQIIWEKEFGVALNNCLKKDIIKHNYNFVDDVIEVECNDIEIKKILDKFDNDCLDVMESFVDLMLIYDSEKKLNDQENIETNLNKMMNFHLKK